MTHLDQESDPGRETGKSYWRSLDELAQTPEFLETLGREFPQGASELEISDGVDRRKFLGLLGASMGLAGVGLGGCVRKPVEHIVEHARRPEEFVPGKPAKFASALAVGPSVLGVIVTSRDGRPTKIDGNPAHALSLGKSSAFAQAAVLEMYDVDRSQLPLEKGQKSNWESLEKHLGESAAGLMRDASLGILVHDKPSPALAEAVSQLTRENPRARIYVQRSAADHPSELAFERLGLRHTRLVHQFSQAQVIAAFDSHVMATEGDPVHDAAGIAAGRKLDSENGNISRIYAVEPSFTLIGMMADHRLNVTPSQVGDVLVLLAQTLAANGLSLPSSVTERLRANNAVSAAHQKWIQTLARDLNAARGRSVIVVGSSQPWEVHALALALNQALDNVGKTVTAFTANGSLLPEAGGLDALAADISSGTVRKLVVVGANPVYHATAELDFAAVMGRLEYCIQLAYHADETTPHCTWHVPMSHALESWGDLRASDGSVSLQQPLIQPLYRSWSDLEFLERLSGNVSPNGYALLQKQWEARNVTRLGFAQAWRRWLHDGLVEAKFASAAAAPALDYSKVANFSPLGGTSSPDALEAVFPLSQSVFDGRYAGIGWLQELPDPVSKLTWDNAAQIGPRTAEKLSLEDGMLVELSVGERKLKLAALIVPGIAEGTVVVHQGYGRKYGSRTGSEVGFNANLLRTQANARIAPGARLSKAGGSYALARTQEYGTQVQPFNGFKRPIYREATLAEYRAKPKFVESGEILPIKEQRTKLWNPEPLDMPNQWGMSVDLNLCNSCNACTVACQSENNIPTVGKARVIQNRDMHWIRIDRYFIGGVDNPQVGVQPVACVHCENAPCEAVCPVGATVHSKEGLNDMVYNRCIGTRFCSNNCPYKVRRFNYFAFQRENDEHNPLYAMQKNPSVTVRFRGVIEKCTYCVQRINPAKAEARAEGLAVVPDGRIVTACQEACPTSAITFGNIADPGSKVSQLKAQNRNYVLLGELNTRPRTSYLARIRNPNQELA